jgi:RNA polymerase sigma-70 factor (ECF subfamily)
MDELVLLKAAQKGSVQAYEMIVRLYEKLVFSVALGILNNRDDASDASQEALFKAYKSIKTCKGGLKAWLCAITRNCCLDQLRKRKPRAVSEVEDEEVLFSLPDKDPPPDEKLLADERKNFLLSAISALKPEFKEVIVLREIHGFSYDEIAEMTKTPAGTVKSRLNRAKDWLRRYLSSVYGNNVSGESV